MHRFELRYLFCGVIMLLKTRTSYVILLFVNLQNVGSLSAHF